MNLSKTFLFFSLTAATILFACQSHKKESTAHRTAEYLPEKVEATDLVRSSAIRVFIGDSLFEYIDGGAELYHLYNFIDVATADYKINDLEIVADIYKFNNSVNAYGLYSMLRPNNARIIRLGVEGFSDEASLEFIKGDFLVRLISYGEAPDISDILKMLAEQINKSLPGDTLKPPAFRLFPDQHKIDNTDKYVAESFLGQKFLTAVYTQDYAIDKDTLTLLLVEEQTTGKLNQWHQAAAGNIDSRINLQQYPFDYANAIAYDDSYYGKIIASMKNSRLVGVINYKDDYADFLAGWLNSL
jgi:hypothetical protein